MSEIQRYDGYRWQDGRIQSRIDLHENVNGRYALYADLLWYKDRYSLSKWFNALAMIALVVAGGVIAALLVTEKAARGPVEVPIGAAEKSGLIQEMQAMQKSRDDYKAMALHYKAQIKVLNTKVDGHVSQLDALQARGQELDRLNKEQAARMSTHQGVVMEAKRVLGVANVQIVER